MKIDIKIERVTPVSDNPYYVVYRGNEVVRCFSFKEDVCDGSFWSESSAQNEAISTAKAMRDGKIEVREAIEF